MRAGIPLARRPPLREEWATLTRRSVVRHDEGAIMICWAVADFDWGGAAGSPLQTISHHRQGLAPLLKRALCLPKHTGAAVLGRLKAGHGGLACPR